MLAIFQIISHFKFLQVIIFILSLNLFLRSTLNVMFLQIICVVHVFIDVQKVASG